MCRQTRWLPMDRPGSVRTTSRPKSGVSCLYWTVLGLLGSVGGAQGRNRTTDTMIFSHVLYQLSYLGAGPARAGRSAKRGRYKGSNPHCPERLIGARRLTA